MCTEIQYGDKIIDTPPLMVSELGISENKLVVAYGYNAINMTIGCLCQVDVAATLTEAGYKYEKDEAGYRIIIEEKEHA